MYYWGEDALAEELTVEGVDVIDATTLVVSETTHTVTLKQLLTNIK